MSADREQKIFESLRDHHIGGGVYEWTLRDVIATVMIEHNDFAPQGSLQCADHILRQAAKKIVELLKVE